MIRLFLLLFSLTGCARPARASFVPEVRVGLRVSQTRDDSALGRAHDLDACGFITLAFRGRSEASALPSRGDASGLLLATPCADDDATCFDDYSSQAPELGPFAEDVP